MTERLSLHIIPPTSKIHVCLTGKVYIDLFPKSHPVITSTQRKSISSKTHQFKNPKYHLNQVEGGSEKTIHPWTQFLPICEPVKLKKRVICSQSAVVG